MRWTLPLGCWMLIAGLVDAADQPAKLNYTDHILPIFRDKCLGCHNLDRARGGLDLSTYVGMMEGGGSGEVIVPGDPEGSRLYKLTAHIEEPKMPPKAPMIAKESVTKLRDWIKAGALENAGSKARIKPRNDLAMAKVGRGKPDVIPMLKAPLSLDPVVVTPRPNAVIALAASPWAPLIAVGGQKQILLYHADSLELLGILPFPPGTPHVLKFSRNGSLLLAGGGRGGHSGKVVVWKVESGEQVLEVGQETDVVLAADISPDHRQIALGGPSKVVRIYSVESGDKLREIRKHTDWVTALSYSPDGVLLASGDRASNLFVWEAFSGNEFYTLQGHKDRITDLAWRDDANILASGSEDGSIHLWAMQNGNKVKNWNAHRGGVLSIAYSHDGRLVSGGRDHQVKLWDGQAKQIRAIKGSSDAVVQTAISHDDQTLLAGDWNGTLKAWDGKTGKERGALATNPPSLKAALSEVKKQLDQIRVELQAATKQRETLQSKLTSLQKQLHAVEKGEKKNAKAIANLQKRQKTLSAQLSQVKQAVSEYRQKMAALEQRRQRYQTSATLAVGDNRASR